MRDISNINNIDSLPKKRSLFVGKQCTLLTKMNYTPGEPMDTDNWLKGNNNWQEASGVYWLSSEQLSLSL